MAPTTLPHPNRLGAVGHSLKYIELASLIELKLAAGRTQDDNDVAQLIQANPVQIPAIRAHLVNIHRDYAEKFDDLIGRAQEQSDDDAP
ncbi:hypothetical protein BH09PLA1_BH09PLA1_06830 [soil metagenome]